MILMNWFCTVVGNSHTITASWYLIVTNKSRKYQKYFMNATCAECDGIGSICLVIVYLALRHNIIILLS